MRPLFLLPLALLAACKPAASPPDNAPRRADVPMVNAEFDTKAAIAPANAAAVPEAMKGEAEARRTLGRWAEAVERGDWPAARALSPTALDTRHEKSRRMKVEIGEGAVEGAAGSLYYEAPVIVTGIGADGKPFRLEGPITLRRVNDVDGATPAQLRWHIERSALKPAGL